MQYNNTKGEKEKEINIKIYQKLCAESKILWTQHCLQRMQERDISRLDVKKWDCDR